MASRKGNATLESSVANRLSATLIQIHISIDIQWEHLFGLHLKQVDFRLVMFRPFVGEVLIAKLKRCDKAGLYCTLSHSFIFSSLYFSSEFMFRLLFYIYELIVKVMENFSVTYLPSKTMVQCHWVLFLRTYTFRSISCNNLPYCTVSFPAFRVWGLRSCLGLRFEYRNTEGAV